MPTTALIRSRREIRRSTTAPAPARAILNQLEQEATERYVPPFERALAYLALGENEKVFTLLEQALEQTLLELYGEQALYRGGLRIRTTLDRALQDDLRRWEESSRDRNADPPEKVLVVKQDGAIRAIVCGADKEEEVRAKLATPGLMVSIYDTAVVSPDSIEKEQIILPESPPAKP